MYKILRKKVMVAGDGQPPGSPLRCLPAGMPASLIPESELAQLTDEHFVIVEPDVVEAAPGTPPEQAIDPALLGKDVPPT